MIDLKRKEKNEPTIAGNGIDYDRPAYPSAYVGDIDDSTFKNLSIGQEVTIKAKITTVSHRESTKESCNHIEVDLISMDPGKASTEFGSRKVMKDNDDTKSAFDNFKKEKNKPSESEEEDEEYESE